MKWWHWWNLLDMSIAIYRDQIATAIFRESEQCNMNRDREYRDRERDYELLGFPYETV